MWSLTTWQVDRFGGQCLKSTSFGHSSEEGASLPCLTSLDYVHVPYSLKGQAWLVLGLGVGG